MLELEKYAATRFGVKVRTGLFNFMDPAQEQTCVAIDWGQEEPLRLYLDSDWIEVWDPNEPPGEELVSMATDWLEGIWMSTEKDQVEKFLNWMKEPSPDPDRWETNLEWFDWGWTHQWVKANSQRVHRDLDRLRRHRSALTY